MTAVQVTMVAACLAVVSCEPPVISSSYGVPSVDSYSPSYSSGGYGGGGGGGGGYGGGSSGGYDGGHHGGHETVGRGGADSSPGEKGDVVSSGGSDISGQTGEGSSVEQETSSSGNGLTEGVNSLGGSGEIGQTKGGIPVQVVQQVTSRSQLEESSIGSNGCSDDKDRFGGGGENVADSTVLPVLGFEPGTTISGVEYEPDPRGESVHSTQPQPPSSGSEGCSGGVNSFVESVNGVKYGSNIGGESVQLNSVFNTQIDTYTKGIPDSTYSNRDQGGIPPDGDTSVSGSESTYYREGSSISSPEQGRFFNRGIDGYESGQNVPTEVNYSHEYQNRMQTIEESSENSSVTDSPQIVPSPQPNRDISEQNFVHNYPSVVQNNDRKSPMGGFLCNNEQTHFKEDVSVRRADFETSYNAYNPEHVVGGEGDAMQETKKNKFYSDGTYRASNVGQLVSGSATRQTKDGQQDYFAEEEVAKRFVERSQTPAHISDTEGRIIPRNENSDDTKYATYSRGGTGYDYSIPEHAWDGDGSNTNALNAWEKSIDRVEIDGLPKLDHGIIQRQSGSLPRIGTSKINGYDSWQDSTYGIVFPIGTNEENLKHYSTWKYNTNAGNVRPMPADKPHEDSLKGTIHDTYHNGNGNQFHECETNHGLENQNNGVRQNDDKVTSVVNKGQTSPWPTWNNLEHGGVQPPSRNANNINIGDKVIYRSKFQTYYSGKKSPYDNTLRGHFIVAGVPNAAKPPLTTHHNTVVTSNHEINSRQAREEISSWNVPHPNTLLEPPILSVSQWEQKPGIGGYPGYGRGGYSVREEETNTGESSRTSEKSGYDSQERSYLSGSGGHVTYYNSGGSAGGIVNHLGAWNSARESTPNQGPTYPSSTNGANNSYNGIYHNTQGNQSFLENGWYTGFSSGRQSQSTGTEGFKIRNTINGVGGYASQKAEGFTSTGGIYNLQGNQAASGTEEYNRHRYGGVVDSTANGRYNSGGHSPYGVGFYSNQQEVSSSSAVGTSNNERNKPFPEAGGYPDHRPVWVGETYETGGLSNVGQDTFGSGGYVNQQRVGYGSNRSDFQSMGNPPPSTYAGGGGYQGYDSSGVDHTYNSKVYGQHATFGSLDNVNQQRAGYGYNQGSSIPMGNRPSPGTGGYQGYGSGRVADTHTSVMSREHTTLGTGGYLNHQGVGYSSNRGPSNPSNPIGNRLFPRYGGYGYGSGGVAQTTYNSGGYENHAKVGSGGYGNQQGVGYSYNQGSTTPVAKQPSPGTGGYQGYGSGGVAQTVRYSSNQGSYTPISNQTPLRTGEYHGYGAHTSSSGVNRDQTSFGSGGYVNQQGVGLSYNRDSSTPIGNQPSPGIGGFKGYGSRGVSHTTSSGGYGQQATFGSEGYANQQGVVYSSNRGSSTPTGNQISPGTNGNQGHGYGVVAQNATSRIYGEHAAFGSGVYENKHGVDYTPMGISFTKLSEKPIPGSGGYPGYGLGGVSQTFSSTAYDKNGVGYSSKGDIYNSQGNTPALGTSGHLGYGFGGSGGGYGTVWKEVGGWKNFTVRPAGFLGYGLSSKPYQFGYAVKDQHTGADFRQQEQSDGNTVKGQYRVALPDGRTQIVTYTADWQTGFHADVQYEGEASYPAVWGGSGGYAPSGSYGAPSSNYGAPSSNYGAPSSSHGAPSSDYGAPGGTGSQYNNIGHHSAGGYGHGGYRK